MDLEKIKKLIDFVGSSHVSQLTVTEGGVTVKILREGERTQTAAPQTIIDDEMIDADAPVVSKPIPTTASPTHITAPSFGLFHRAPSPGAPPFIEVGDTISIGQDLFIIEAMKMFNTVKSDRSGKVVAILANDGEDVEYGQPIVELE